MPVLGQLRQPVESDVEHAAHDAWQPAQRATVPTTSTRVPAEHSATHAPNSRKDALGSEQLVHWLLEGPTHVPALPQLESHGEQVPPTVSAYVATGQMLWQWPEACLNGWDALHVTHSAASGPEHVEQLSAHGTHASSDAMLPPEHVKPASTVQSKPQPSPATRLPSSHSSLPTRRPSPHSGVQTSFDARLPPTQV